MRFMVQDYFELRANSYIRRKEDKQMTQEEMRKIASREYGRNDTSMGNAMQPVGNRTAGKVCGKASPAMGSNQPQRGIMEAARATVAVEWAISKRGNIPNAEASKGRSTRPWQCAGHAAC